MSTVQKYVGESSYATLPEKPVRTRKRRDIKVYYIIRHRQRHDLKPRPIVIRLTMDGETISDYSSGVYILPAQWDQTMQRTKGRNQLATQANERLAEIQAQHHEILRELKRRYEKGEGPRPTPRLVKQEFLKPGSTTPHLYQWFRGYLNFLDTLHHTEDGRAEKTMQRAYKTLDYIYQFTLSGLNVPPNTKRWKSAKDLVEINRQSPLLSDITTGWGKRFHAWLQVRPGGGERRMQKDSANKYLAHVRDALDHAVNEGMLALNPLDKFRPKRGKGKEVYFLEPEHLEKLLGLALPGQAGVALWWMKLMCFTGLDYIDAIRYARNRQSFHRRNDAGLKIVIERSKPPRNTCEIPMIGQGFELIDALFIEYPTGPVAPVLADLNRHLKLIQVAIGFNKPLTSKICRKTGGAFLLREGYRIETVSKALGHSSIRTTEDHYVKVTTSAVDHDMDRVSHQQAQRTIRLQPNVINLPFHQLALNGSYSSQS